jgi:thiamine pyrophosphokinase
VVTASGCEYPLTDYTLTRKNSFAVSNEITAAAATVTVRGKVLLAQSK